MISRKRILSNSCTHLSSEGSGGPSKGCSFDDDVWFDKDSLYRDHIQEILNKYNQLDDEIWGKIICMERNRRVAKAYARSPVITIDNGSIGFDGDSIGLRGFENPYRDTEILVTHKSISSGVAIGADEAVPNSSSSDLASSWSCSSCSTSCSDVERMDKFPLNHRHKSTGNLRDVKDNCKSNANSSNSKCTRCRGNLNEIHISSKCQSSNGNNTSKIKSLALSKSNTGHHRGHQIKSDHEVSSVSERLGKLFIPFNEDEDESTLQLVVNGKSSSSTINCNGQSKIENLNSIRHSSWQSSSTTGGPSSNSTGSGGGCNNNFQLNEQVTEIDSPFSLSHSSSSTSNSSSDIVKCNTLTHTGHLSKLNKSNGNKVRKGGQFHHHPHHLLLHHHHQQQQQHHQHHNQQQQQQQQQHNHHSNNNHTSPGEFSSSSSSGYAVTSETTSSTTTTANGTTSVSNLNDRNGRLVKRNIDDHFVGHFDKQIDQENQCNSNSKTKCLVNCDTNKGENCNCGKGNCGNGNSLSGGNLTSMIKKAKSQTAKGKKSQFNNNSNSTNNGKSNTKSSISNNGHDFTFDEGHNDSYNCNSTSSSLSASGGSNFNDDSNGGQGASNLPHKVKSSISKITSNGNNRLNNNNNSSCPPPPPPPTTTATTTASSKATSGNNLTTHALVENQLTKSTNDSKVLTLGTHSQCNLPHVPSGKIHRAPQVNNPHNSRSHHHHHHRQEQNHQVSMSCKSSKSSKLNSQRINNDHSSCIDEWDSAIPTPDYDDSGNENYGFIGARSGFGGHRLRLCTSNLLLSENCYHCNQLPSSNCSEFYTESNFNPRLSQSTNYLSSDHGDRDRDQEEEDEIYTTTAIMSTNSNGGFLNSVLRHLPLSTITSKQRKSGKYNLNYQTSWKRLSFPGIFSTPIGHNDSLTPSMSSAGDSDNSYTHIYSSICDSAVGTSTTTTSSNFYGRNNCTSKNGPPRNDFRAKEANGNNSNSKSSNSNNSNNSFYTHCSCNSIKDENGYCYKSNCRYFNGKSGTISYSSTNGINGKNNLCNAFVDQENNGSSVKGKYNSATRQGNFSSIKCATLSMPAISFGHSNNTISKSSKSNGKSHNRHMSIDGKLDDSFNLPRRPHTPGDHPGHQSALNTGKIVKPLSRSTDFTMDCPYVALPFDSSIGDIDTNPSAAAGPSTAKLGPNSSASASGLGKPPSSKGSTLGAKLARKGSKGLKRATSIPKTLKLFIKRNGKRSVSE